MLIGFAAGSYVGIEDVDEPISGHRIRRFDPIGRRAKPIHCFVPVEAEKRSPVNAQLRVSPCTERNSTAWKNAVTFDRDAVDQEAAEAGMQENAEVGRVEEGGR